MCTALEQWLQKEGKKEFKKGEKQGLEKGEKRGLEKRDRELILKWTAAGYQTAMIADLLGYSEEDVRKVQNEKTTVDVC